MTAISPMEKKIIDMRIVMRAVWLFMLDQNSLVVDEARREVVSDLIQMGLLAGGLRKPYLTDKGEELMNSCRLRTDILEQDLEKMYADFLVERYLLGVREE